MSAPDSVKRKSVKTSRISKNYDLEGTNDFTNFQKINGSLLKELMPDTKNQKLFENFLVDRVRLAEILCLAPSTISKMMVEDGLPHYKIGKSCRYKVSEVMAFLEKRKRP